MLSITGGLQPLKLIDLNNINHDDNSGLLRIPLLRLGKEYRS